MANMTINFNLRKYLSTLELEATGAWLVLTIIMCHANMSNRAWPKNSTLVNETGLCQSTVTNALKALFKIGAIIRVPGNRRVGKEQKLANSASVYQLTGYMIIQHKIVPYLYNSDVAEIDLIQALEKVIMESGDTLSQELTEDILRAEMFAVDRRIYPKKPILQLNEETNKKGGNILSGNILSHNARSIYSKEQDIKEKIPSESDVLEKHQNNISDVNWTTSLLELMSRKWYTESGLRTYVMKCLDVALPEDVFAPIGNHMEHLAHKTLYVLCRNGQVEYQDRATHRSYRLSITENDKQHAENPSQDTYPDILEAIVEHWKLATGLAKQLTAVVLGTAKKGQWSEGADTFRDMPMTVIEIVEFGRYKHAEMAQSGFNFPTKPIILANSIKQWRDSNVASEPNYDAFAMKSEMQS